MPRRSRVLVGDSSPVIIFFSGRFIADTSGGPVMQSLS